MATLLELVLELVALPPVLHYRRSLSERVKTLVKERLYPRGPESSAQGSLARFAPPSV